MRIVVGLGGNALLRRDQALTSDNQAANIEAAADALAPLAEEHALVVVHGNGPQVGLLALQDASMPEVGNFPLDVLAAETSGMIGYPVARALRNRLPERKMAGILTQIEVSSTDPAFADPTKPIGPVYDASDADDLMRRFGWRMRPEGRGFRRVVPSPAPLRIVEMDAIRILVDAGVLVLCAGGGGIPVVVDALGHTLGVEAVIDKDASAALVAEELDADALLLLTDVEAVMADFGSEDPRPLRSLSPDEAEALDLPSGSMRPKVEAAAGFARATSRPAYIGNLREAAAILRGERGTVVRAAGGGG
ncbi:MAG: carbamate kinase [Longimicrobiales bacterium]